MCHCFLRVKRKLNIGHVFGVFNLGNIIEIKTIHPVLDNLLLLTFSNPLYYIIMQIYIVRLWFYVVSNRYCKIFTLTYVLLFLSFFVSCTVFHFLLKLITFTLLHNSLLFTIRRTVLSVLPNTVRSPLLLTCFSSFHRSLYNVVIFVI